MTRYIQCFLVLFMISVISIAQDAGSDKTVIFPKEKVIGNNSPTARFTPTQEEIQEADAIVKVHLKEKYPNETVKLDEYYRQYYGTILAGQRIINMNASCKMPEKFVTELAAAKSGGNCNFDARINMKGKKVMSLKFNGTK
jgi:hypothetical protein